MERSLVAAIKGNLSSGWSRIGFRLRTRVTVPRVAPGLFGSHGFQASILLATGKHHLRLEPLAVVEPGREGMKRRNAAHGAKGGLIQQPIARTARNGGFVGPS
jgi:hypothetical protein